jgi:hypothetical protein
VYSADSGIVRADSTVSEDSLGKSSVSWLVCVELLEPRALPRLDGIFTLRVRQRTTCQSERVFAGSVVGISSALKGWRLFSWSGKTRGRG